MKKIVCKQYLAGASLFLLLGCQYTNVPPPNGLARIIPLIEGSPIEGGVDFVQGPTGVIVSAQISGLEDGSYSVYLQDPGGCQSQTGSKLLDLQIDNEEGFARGSAFLPGSSISESDDELINRVVAIRPSSGAVLACGDIMRL